MTQRRLTLLLAALVFLLPIISTGAQDARIKLSTSEEIKEDFNSVPCEDKKRLEAAMSLFQRAGVPSSDVTIEKYKDVENLVVTRKGESSEKIIEGAGSDSSSFISKKIPAVTIHGLSDEWPKILHSRNDQVSQINPLSVYLGYRLTLAMIVELDSSPCAAYK